MAVATAVAPPAREPVDYMDVTCLFFDTMPKNCIKTLRYTLSWANQFFKNLAAYPQVTNAASALKQGTAIFIWPEFIIDMNTLRLKTMKWISGSRDEHAETIGTLSLAFSDALNKVCDLTQWLVETNILTLAKPILSNLTLINGLTLMYSFGSRAVTTSIELYSAPDDKKMWKLAKNISLCALGALISISSFTPFLNPVCMLICSTVSLVASYSTFILEHPVVTTPA